MGAGGRKIRTSPPVVTAHTLQRPVVIDDFAPRDYCAPQAGKDVS